MPKIVYKGKEYQSLADMPAKTRHDYFKAKAGYEVTEEDKDKANADVLPKGLENMPPDVREIYERVRGDLDAKPIKASPIDELPRTEDLYRRSAPDAMKDMPSDEVMYKPSPPIIEPPPPIVQSDHTLRRLLIAVGIAVLLIGIAVALFLNS